MPLRLTRPKKEACFLSDLIDAFLRLFFSFSAGGAGDTEGNSSPRPEEDRRDGDEIELGLAPASSPNALRIGVVACCIEGCVLEEGDEGSEVSAVLAVETDQRNVWALLPLRPWPTSLPS
jgi:hypothetical protein